MPSCSFTLWVWPPFFRSLAYLVTKHEQALGTVINCVRYKVLSPVENTASNISSPVPVHNFMRIWYFECLFQNTLRIEPYLMFSHLSNGNLIYQTHPFKPPFKDVVPSMNMCPFSTVLGRSSVLPQSVFDLSPNLPPAFLPAAHRSRQQAVNQCAHWRSSHMKESFLEYSDKIITSHTIRLQPVGSQTEHVNSLIL